MHGRDTGAQRSKKPVNTEQRRAPLLSIADPRPLPTMTPLWRGAAQAATIGIFIILLLAALDLGRTLLLPVASAFVVTMMLGPVSARANRYRIPNLLTALVLWLLVIAAFYGLIILLSAPAVEWLKNAPDIGRVVEEKLHVLDAPLNALRDLRNAILPAEGGKGVNFDIMTIIQPAVAIVTPALGEVLVFFGALFFMLYGRSQMRHVLVGFFHGREARLRMLRILNDVEHNLTSYLSVVAVINIFVGVGAGCIAWAVGLPQPLAWGVLAFILNFIPYLGALIMEIGMFMAGVVTFPSLTYALIAPLSFLALGIVEGHFLTPSILGNRFTLNPLTVFLSLVFWTWLWGPVGAFLAAPLLLMGMVAVIHLFPADEPELPE